MNKRYNGGRPKLYDEKKIQSKVYLRPVVKEKIESEYKNLTEALETLYGLILAQEQKDQINNLFKKES